MPKIQGRLEREASISSRFDLLRAVVSSKNAVPAIPCSWEAVLALGTFVRCKMVWLSLLHSRHPQRYMRDSFGIPWSAAFRLCHKPFFPRGLNCRIT